jgi:hypothetical protein
MRENNHLLLFKASLDRLRSGVVGGMRQAQIKFGH